MKYPCGKAIGLLNRNKLCDTYSQKEKNRKPFYGILDAFISLGSTYLKE